MYVNIQGDEPLITPRHVALLVAPFRERPGAQVTTLKIRLLPDEADNPNVNKVVCGVDGRALYFSRAAIPFLRDPDDRSLLSGRVHQHIGVYAYQRDALARWVALPPHPLEQIERLEQLRPLAAGIAMGVVFVDEVPRAGIDTEDDLARANSDWTALTPERI